jgi:hypothetical protein
MIAITCFDVMGDCFFFKFYCSSTKDFALVYQVL